MPDPADLIRFYDEDYTRSSMRDLVAHLVGRPDDEQHERRPAPGTVAGACS